MTMDYTCDLCQAPISEEQYDHHDGLCEKCAEKHERPEAVCRRCGWPISKSEVKENDGLCFMCRR